MSNLNQIAVTGRLTKDAVKRTFPPSGTEYLTFSVANNTGYGDFAKANFFDCKLIGKRAGSLAQYLVKGKQVALTGVIESNDYVDKEGTRRYGWQITVSDIELLGGGQSEQQQGFDYGDDLDKRLKREANEAYMGRNKEVTF